MDAWRCSSVVATLGCGSGEGQGSCSAMMARVDPFSRPAEEGIFASFTPSSWVEVDEREEIGEMVAERPHSADFAIAETSSGGHLPIHFQNRPALVFVQLQHHR